MDTASWVAPHVAYVVALGEGHVATCGVKDGTWTLSKFRLGQPEGYGGKPTTVKLLTKPDGLTAVTVVGTLCIAISHR